MGCDIHCFAEYKIKGKWRFAKEVDISRDYALFGRMASCGRSIDTVPINPNKGIPDDADFMTKFYMDAFADHSHSWLTGNEVINLFHEFPKLPFDHDQGESVWYSWERWPDSHWGIEDFRWVFGFDN